MTEADLEGMVLGSILLAALSMPIGSACDASPSLSFDPQPPGITRFAQAPVTAASGAEAPDTAAANGSAVSETAAGAEISDTTRAGGWRSLPTRIGRTTRNFASDLWVVVSSPGRLNRHGGVRLAVVLAVGGVLYAYDEDLLEASLRNRDATIWHAIQEVGSFVEPVGYMGRTNPYYVAACGAGYLLDVKPLREIPMQILESHLIAGGLRNGLKLLLGRRRPYEGRGPYFFELNGGTSLPSGHTSVLFELATILGHHSGSGPVTVLLYGLAGTGALQRVHSRSHWPSDLVLSAVSGTMIARAVVRRHEERVAMLKTGFFLHDDGTLRLGVSLPLGGPENRHP